MVYRGLSREIITDNPMVSDGLFSSPMGDYLKEV